MPIGKGAGRRLYKKKRHKKNFYNRASIKKAILNREARYQTKPANQFPSATNAMPATMLTSK